MLSPEVWLGKPFSKARIQGQKKHASSVPVTTSQGGRAAPEQPDTRSGQSRASAALRALPAPKLSALRSNINFLELRTLLPQPVGTQRVRAVLEQEAEDSTKLGSETAKAAAPATRNAELLL